MTAIGFSTSSSSHHPSFRRVEGRAGGGGPSEFMPPGWQVDLQRDRKLCASFEDFYAAFVQTGRCIIYPERLIRNRRSG